MFSPTFYFATVDADQTTFHPSFARNDYVVLAAAMSQEEGQFASLEIVVKNPRRPLLGDKIWLWFSYDGIETGGVTPLFFGRLVGIPQSVFNERVTLQFMARPVDFGSRKSIAAAALKVLPYYDKIFIDEQHRDDLDGVLEGYSKVWHIDRVTHNVGTSDVLIGEEGEIEFDASQLLYDGFEIAFNQIPLTSVEVEGVFNWDQIATGSIDLTDHILARWPNEGHVSVDQGVITSFTLQDVDWPTPGKSLGRGWIAAEGTQCIAVYDLQPQSKSDGFTVTIDWGSWANLGGSTGGTSTTFNTSDQYLKEVPPGSISLPPIITDQSNDARYTEADPDRGGPSRLASYSMSTEWTDSVIPLNHLKPTLLVTYEANRPRAETVRFTLVAEIQPIVSLPGEDEIEKVILNSVRLNDPLDEPTDDPTSGALLAPMRDVRRRSYAVTERGEDSLKYLISVARAKLLKRSRAVQITHQITTAAALELIPDLTLRKNIRVNDPRLPDGEALGKLISYRFAIESGRLECKITIGSAPGRGGAVEAIGGNPTYAEADVMGPDVQEFTGRYLTFNSDVAYSRALFLPDDDGVDFLTDFDADDIIETALSVENGPAVQRAVLENGVAKPGLNHGLSPFMIGANQGDEQVDARTRVAERLLEEKPTAARFTLRNMEGAFDQDQTIPISELKIPTMINLESSTAA